MRISFIFFLIISFSFTASSQDFEYNKPTGAEWEIKNYNNDTSIHAVVLREFGKAHISVGENLPVIFEHHVRIKIFDTKGFESGKVVVSLYNGGRDMEDRVRFIKAATFTRDENGIVKKTVFNTDDVQRLKVNERYDDVKFSLPALQPGCIIEYSYETEAPYHDKFHKWEFQSDIPKIHSEYIAVIPAILEYKVSLRGPLQLTAKKITQQPQSFKFFAFTADCTTISYTMDNIPPFIEEEYMTAPSNYISALHFEILSTATGDNFVQKLTKEWKDVDYTLKYHEKFGEVIRNTSVIKKHLPDEVFNIADTLAKAKAIYAYLQKTLKWNSFISIFAHDGIEKTFDISTGNCADINLSLIAALQVSGINCDAIILSTRDNGIVNKLYPVLTNFNYVIAKANIGGQSYLLDATDPMLSFGMLPLRCINDQGRVISSNKPSYWIDMVQPVKRNTAITLTMTMQPDGTIKGTYTRYSMGYAAYETRRSVKSYKSIGAYLDTCFKKIRATQASNWALNGLDSLDTPVTLSYEFELPANKDADGNILFNPSFLHHIDSNPFKLAYRNYPVDMGSSLKANVSIILTYPPGFTVIAQPDPVNIALPGSGGIYLTNLAVEPGIIKYSQVEQLNKAIYSPSEYPSLKEFYNKIIQNQSLNIKLKKKP